jgi:hypothetical protein
MTTIHAQAGTMPTMRSGWERDPLLVCEGLCNGGSVQRFDQAVLAAKDRLAIAPSVLEAGRALVHTKHVAVAGTSRTYRCSVCSNERAWGF